MKTGDIISLITLIITSIAFVVSIFPVSKRFLISSIINKKNKIFYVYKLLLPYLFSDPIKFKKMDEEIWSMLNETLFNTLLCTSYKFNPAEFKPQGNKELFEFLREESIKNLLLLFKNFLCLERKTKFIAKEIDKARILKIGKNGRYDSIYFRYELSNDKIAVIENKIIPIDYYNSFNHFDNHNQQNQKINEEEFNLTKILRNTKKGIKSYLNNIKDRKFSILLTIRNNLNCGCPNNRKKEEHNFQLLLNFNEERWNAKIEKLNIKCSNFNKNEYQWLNEHIYMLEISLNQKLK